MKKDKTRKDKKSKTDAKEDPVVDEVLEELKKKQEEDKKLLSRAKGVLASFRTAQN